MSMFENDEKIDTRIILTQNNNKFRNFNNNNKM